ncbi:MAG: pantetheine-phosphate adenylyltransferase [Candidatus Omnitrophica bacterium]|nr:pantetheine-phosphate adenylyltransferase [Candidatus Omnitrophota bacterium]
MKVLYPGSFDPITLGHIDLIKRSIKLFDQVCVAVVAKSPKDTLFDFEERMDLVKKCLKGFKKVKVEGFEGLVVDYAKLKKIKIILRGLRMISDFEYEFQMALTNRTIKPDIETMFLMPEPNYSYVSSRLIKEAFFLGADISRFVPSYVLKALVRKKDEIRY